MTVAGMRTTCLQRSYTTANHIAHLQQFYLLIELTLCYLGHLGQIKKYVWFRKHWPKNNRQSGQLVPLSTRHLFGQLVPYFWSTRPQIVNSSLIWSTRPLLLINLSLLCYKSMSLNMLFYVKS
jgi:hypothetical protein